jgi:hypothetical protein
LPITRKDENSTAYGRSFSKSDLQRITINGDDNWFLIVTQGADKGLFFDFPGSPNDRLLNPPDIGIIFEGFISHLEFLRSYHSHPELKIKIFETGWFPFSRIRGNRFNGISNEIQQGNVISSLENSIVNSFSDEEIRNIKESWMRNKVFLSHKSLFNEGIEAYLNEKFICAIHILYPRIEGIMRFLYRGNKKQPYATDIVDDLINITKEKKVGLSYQFPDDFKSYMTTFYFRRFNVKENRLNLSRHSLGHGTTNADEFTKIRAFQAILILDQISWYVYTSILE